MSQKFKKASFWMLIGGNVLSIIACFLPFVEVLFLSKPYIDGEGKFVLALNVIAIVLAFVKIKFAFIPNIVSMSLVCLTFVDCINEGMIEFLAIGAYLVVIANTVALFGGVKDKK